MVFGEYAKSTNLASIHLGDGTVDYTNEMKYLGATVVSSKTLRFSVNCENFINLSILFLEFYIVLQNMFL